MGFKLGDRLPREVASAESVESVAVGVEADPNPKVCPICDHKGPFERLKENARYCPRCHHAFKVDQAGEVLEWWPTQKSAARRT